MSVVVRDGESALALRASRFEQHGQWISQVNDIEPGKFYRFDVMYLGCIVEQGPMREVLHRPRHPYTQALLHSIPSLDSSRPLVSIPGTVPALSAVPGGCAFHPRCAYAQVGRCDAGGPPALRPLGAGAVACVRAEEIAAGARSAASLEHA
jgi:oligopeptide/dipeptide ABC transporter ATP-binding protein